MTDRPGPARVGAALLCVAPLLAPAAGLAAQDGGAGGGAATPEQATPREPDVPYVATPMPVVEAMLELARVDGRDSLFDLGSGDGRIVIAAARRYGTRGVGVEIDSGLVAASRRNAREAGVDGLVSFVRGDLFEVDLSAASVVTLYLLSSVNRRLRPKLLAELRPGARIVSHAFGMGEWGADSLIGVPQAGDRRAYLFHWVVPADVGGTWRVETSGGDVFTLEVDQLYQELRMRVVEGPPESLIRDPVLRGTGLAFVLGRLGDGGRGRRFVGSVFGDEMWGAYSGGSWSARRIGRGGEPIDRW